MKETIEIIAVIIALVLLVYLGYEDDKNEKERIKKKLLGIKSSSLYYICLIFFLFIVFLLSYI